MEAASGDVAVLNRVLGGCGFLSERVALTRLVHDAGLRWVGRSRHDTFVEVAGIEPASFSTSPRLLRVQPAVLFSAPAVTQASCRRAQSLLGVPVSPATGLSGESSSLMPDTGPEELLG
jgi:hypothetical protein